MVKTTGIEWADATWNPWRGCKKVSTGCKNCYAERDMKRFGHDFTVPTRSKTTFLDPLKWADSKVVFVCSWSDFFWEEVPEDWRMEAWEIMHKADWHTYLLLTKRPENIARMLPIWWWSERHPNIWLGTSVESQRFAYRIEDLLSVQADVHFLSAEPLLGPLMLSKYLYPNVRRLLNPKTGESAPHGLKWVITGGESDLHAPQFCDPNWVRDIRDQCLRSNVAFFHKQHGGTRKIDGAWGGRELDGRTWDEVPERKEYAHGNSNEQSIQTSYL